MSRHSSIQAPNRFRRLSAETLRRHAVVCRNAGENKEADRLQAEAFAASLREEIAQEQIVCGLARMTRHRELARYGASNA